MVVSFFSLVLFVEMQAREGVGVFIHGVTILRAPGQRIVLYDRSVDIDPFVCYYFYLEWKKFN